jgi:hypothetical protein
MEVMAMEEKEVQEQKQRIVIELKEDDYRSLIALKTLIGVSWRDILVAGAIWWIEKLNLEEYLENLRKKIDNLIRTNKQ